MSFLTCVQAPRRAAKTPSNTRAPKALGEPRKKQLEADRQAQPYSESCQAWVDPANLRAEEGRGLEWLFLAHQGF